MIKTLKLQRIAKHLQGSRWKLNVQAIQVLLLLFCFVETKAQLHVTNGTVEPYTPIDLIQNVFLGKGVEIVDIKYEGLGFSVGYFENASNQIKLDRGILMTTGKADLADDPNNESNTTSHSSGVNLTDPDLLKALGLDPGSPNVLQDIARYTIRFIPYDDSLSFNYVFASEEYPEYACSQYKDVFGFFITGPDPDGGFYQAKNIALVPETNEVVSISNVNNGDGSPFCFPKNPQYYNENSDGQHLTYNAFLDIFTAGARVIPCQEYTIKITISDVADALYDSAVFLEAKSFSTNGIDVSLETPNPDKKIAENCDQAILTFSFNEIRYEDFEIDFNILDQGPDLAIAEKNIDYTGFPDQLIIPAGKKSLSLVIKGIEDNLEEGDEWILVDYQKNACLRDTIRLAVIDRILPKPVIEDPLFLCYGDSVKIELTFPDNFSFPESQTFQNTHDYAITPINTPIFSDIFVQGVNAPHMGPGVLKKVCIDTAWNSDLEDFDFFLYSPGGQFIELSSDNGKRTLGGNSIDSLINTCFTPEASLYIHNGNPETGDMDPANPTFTGNYIPEGQWEDLWPDDNQPVNGIWRLMVVDDSQAFVGHLESWSIGFSSAYSISYDWQPEDSFISCNDCMEPYLFPAQTSQYQVTGMDSYGCIFTDSILLEVEYIPPVEKLKCDSVSTDYLRFKWQDLSDFDVYEYQINQDGNWISTPDTFVSFSGLNYSEEIELSVRTFSDQCAGIVSTAVCTTYPCPAPDIEVTRLEHLNCHGDKDGLIEVKASGLNSPYYFEYGNKGNYTGYFDQLPGGDHTIYITDSDQCTVSLDFTIEEPDSIQFNLETHIITCFGSKDGSIMAHPTGGTGSISYYWENQNGETFYQDYLEALEPGVYTIYGEDQAGCQVMEMTELIEPAPIVFHSDITPVKCHGDYSGSIHLTVAGGFENFTYEWNLEGIIYKTKDLASVKAGLYQLTITDGGGCQIDTSLMIDEPEESLFYSVQAVDTICKGASNGRIELSVSGGSGNYSILWNNGFDGTILENLGGGLYSFEITDENHCKEIGRVEILELPDLSIQTEQIAPSCHDSKNGVLKLEKALYNQEELVLSDLSIVWSTQPKQYNPTANYLTGGQYYPLTITDTRGCSHAFEIYLDRPDSIKIREQNREEISCFGMADGGISLSASGGTSPYSFKWSGNNIMLEGEDASNLASGFYAVTVSDVNNCKANYYITLEDPAPISTLSKTEPVSCYDGKNGSVEIDINGGFPPYIVEWSNGQMNRKATNLPPGTVHVRITDNRLCQKTDSFFIQQPEEPLILMAETSDVLCKGGHDGKILLEGAGGTPPYVFELSNRPKQGNAIFIGLTAGVYSGIITDARMCQDTILQIRLDHINELFVDLGPDTTLLYGERMQLIPSVTSLNSESFNFTWESSKPGVLSCYDCSKPILNTDIPVGLSLAVSDENDCKAEDYIYITVKTKKYINVPTAFTPNDDGKNDKLFVFGAPGTKILQFEIYDTWGNKVCQLYDFYVNDSVSGWDGRFKGQYVDPGVYSWYLRAAFIDGSEMNFKGETTVLK